MLLYKNINHFIFTAVYYINLNSRKIVPQNVMWQTQLVFMFTQLKIFTPKRHNSKKKSRIKCFYDIFWHKRH